MKNLLLILLIATGISAHAQLTISNGNHVLEITGNVTAIYNNRFYKPAYADNKKDNRFDLQNARIQFEGRAGKSFEYELEVDLATLSSGVSDPENPALVDANITYKLPKIFSITAGYGKVPYSRSSMVPNTYSPYFQRAEIVRGDVFSQRDIGIMLNAGFWKQLVNVSAGVYTGMGELSLKGQNDALGKFEYVAHADISYPVRNRYQDVDNNVSPVPVACLGISGRYADKKNTIYDTYSLKVVGGKKFTYGIDFSVKYKGFSIQAEIHQMRITPTDEARLFDYNTKFFRAGGYYVQATYYNKFLKTLFSARFDELNENDLWDGYGRRLTGAICFLPKGYNLMIKANYTHILSEEILPDQTEGKWTGQLRIGVQYLFR